MIFPVLFFPGRGPAAWGGGGPGTGGRTLVQEHLDEGHAQAEDIASRGGVQPVVVFGIVIL